MELADIFLVVLVVLTLIYILNDDSDGGSRGRLPAAI
jgi:hypothetical protein